MSLALLPSASTEAQMMLRLQPRVMALALAAAKRACGGRMPSRAELRTKSVVEGVTDDAAKTFEILVRWQGEVVLVIRPAEDGMTYEFMGAAKGA